LKIFICADVHGNVRALDAVLAVYRDVSPCEFLFLGDCVGYGAHPDACLDRILNLPKATLLLGNHEAVLLSQRDYHYMNPIASQALKWTVDKVFDRYGAAIRDRFQIEYERGDMLAIHSSPANPEEWPYIFTQFEADEAFYEADFSACFVGHTHIPAIFSSNQGRMWFDDGVFWELDPKDRYIINPGSVGQPRDGDPRAACCVYDTDKATIELFRCEYDVASEAEDIFDAGLPRYLGERLLKGA
jgi:diadenosine tetraphosphatase ApaH/serine/threonine PP2A family protein phosphatase